ncbi:hypothetical protein EX30DRAFT_259584 [Ascodesmis nigricans]|uniref:Uncharacterized protein n=1 Tax=Ascodesmis nigricans TaxID=341454 RepID=A0A4V3SIU0_9PEZI|nr:hypothetical protein EX30DRAFT_259584 [Ascodesmis nigricans]
MISLVYTGVDGEFGMLFGFGFWFCFLMGRRFTVFVFVFLDMFWGHVFCFVCISLVGSFVLGGGALGAGEGGGEEGGGKEGGTRGLTAGLW